MTATEPRITSVEVGAARSSGPSVQDLHAADTRPVPESLLDHSYEPQGMADVPKSRYTSPEFAALEAEFMWTRTWQMACHLDEVREVGDHVVYDVAGQSLLVVRSGPDTVRAYHNACLHRGTKLRTEGGRLDGFRCPFHGWRWNLDGELTTLPAGWDFPHVESTTERSCLPEAKVATFAGWVFVNMDPDAMPFEEYAAKLVEHFGRDFAIADRYVAFHAVKEVPANWKIVMEAFGEGYHVIATHPQILKFAADENSEYSIWPESPYVTRFVNGFGAQSPHLGPLSEQQVADAYLEFSARGAGGSVEVPEGSTARAVVAEAFRAGLSQRYGMDLSHVSDTEILDAHLYHLFPAFAPWAGHGQTLTYRWRPGPTPDTSYMDVYRMQPVPPGSERPDPAPCQVLTLDQDWHEADGMGGLADVFEQDMSNLPRVQAGMYSTGKPGVSFGNYQEARLRLTHRHIDDFVRAGLEAAGRDAAELDRFAVPEG